MTFKRSILYTVTSVTVYLASSPAWAQHVGISVAMLSTRSEGVPLVTDLAEWDGIPASMAVTSGYVYVASARGALAQDQPVNWATLPKHNSNEVETTYLENGVGVNGRDIQVSNSFNEGFTSAFATKDAFKTTYGGSIMNISLTPRTSVTFNTIVVGHLEVPSVDGYLPPDKEMPGIQAQAYSYVGPANLDALAAHGHSHELFDPHTDGDLCAVCSNSAIYWQDNSLDPSMGDPFGGYDFLSREHESTQTFTITNDTDNMREFQVVKFFGVRVMNVTPVASAVPEPSKVVMLGAGLTALMAARRLRRRNG